MAAWGTMKRRITASVRTTNRMNALLLESMLGKRKALMKNNEAENTPEETNEKPKNDWKFFSRNFSMEQVYKLIESVIDERTTWDRFSRVYDSHRSLAMVESLAKDIRDRMKKLNHKRHRIVCFISIIERQNQGVHMSMRHFMNEKTDNFTNMVYERPTYFLVVVAYFVYKN